MITTLLSRQLVENPNFHMVPGMLVRFREEDGTWTTRRFRDFDDFGVFAPDEYHRDRFDICLDDFATAAILLRMAMQQRQSAMRGTSAHFAPGLGGWNINDGEREGDLGVCVAIALLASWATAGAV